MDKNCFTVSNSYDSCSFQLLFVYFLNVHIKVHISESNLFCFILLTLKLPNH